jgi:Ctr copper transporter family
MPCDLSPWRGHAELTGSSVVACAVAQEGGRLPDHTAPSRIHDLVQRLQAGTHVTLWLQSWHTHNVLQYALSFLFLGALAVAAEALSALRAR